MKCPGCGEQIPEEAKFCIFCGHELSRRFEVHCLHCGGDISKYWGEEPKPYFCPYCGGGIPERFWDLF